MYVVEIIHRMNPADLTLQSFSLKEELYRYLLTRVSSSNHRTPNLSLFSGDSLFNAGVGNCHGGGDVSKLYESTCLLKDLDDSTLLYPGHDYRLKNLKFAQFVEPENKLIAEKLKELEDFQSENLPPVSLGEEKLVNPFLRLHSLEIRQKVQKETLGLFEKDLSERELFKCLRLMRDQW